MAEFDITPEMRDGLAKAQSAQEVKDILAASGQEVAEEVAERIWQEVEQHEVDYGKELSEDELAAVAGGFLNRRPKSEGCLATYDTSLGGWCGSNDACALFDVIYTYD